LTSPLIGLLRHGQNESLHPQSRSVTCRRSPEVSSTAFHAQPPDLPPVRWMDMGFAINCPLARTVALVSGSCSSARAFAPRFFQAPPRGECDFTFALRYDFTSIRLSKGLSPSSCRNMLGTQ
jgi:hypothetical protein